MGEIIVTSAQLRAKAEELNSLNEQFKGSVDTLKDEEAALHSQFEGEAADAFHSAFTSDSVQMMNFYNAIAQYVQKLLQIAERYEKAEQQAAALAAQRNY